MSPATALAPAAASAQESRDFGDLAGGPYDRLVIRGAMVAESKEGIGENVVTEPFAVEESF